MRKLLTLVGVLGIALTGHSQSGTTATWDGNISTRTVFIENIGQYDQFSSAEIGEVQYALNFGELRIFFGERGLFYYYLQAEKMSKEERMAIMNTPPDQLPHYEKERLIGKFNFKMEEVKMTWEGASPNVLLKPAHETTDHFSISVQDPATQEVTNYPNIKGYTKLTYKNLYPNIDVVYEVHPDQGIKYSAIVHPGANPNDIQIAYDGESTLTNGEIVVPNYFGEIREKAPLTFYESNQNNIIQSQFVKTGDIYQFELENYDVNQTIVIDPWVLNSTFNTSSAVWEVETDLAGNVYVIGGETPFQLRKFNSAGTLQWTYTSPWDTSNVWIGTLATAGDGTSYITAGTSPEIERINNAGGMVWHNNGGFSGGLLTEYWSISFNCDNTKLIVGGTSGGFNPTPAIYDMNITNGNVNTYQTFTAGSLFSPVEVRSISSSKNAKYIFLTHTNIGAINQNMGFCPNPVPIYELPNNSNLSYKCENYLPSTQNGGGLKALVANDTYFYTHEGNSITRWDLINGTMLNSVALPGGSAGGFIGSVVHCSGLSVDDCGNIYAGSMDRVVKFDPNLNIISQVMVPFNVYDVCVNSNTEVLAVGAQGNNSVSTMGGRNGRIQSCAFTACAKYAIVCCDANFCPVGPLCENDPPVALTPSTAGGTWSGVGVDAFGNFDPSVAGVGNHPITYTLPCGSETIVISVITCNSPIEVCEETNGDLTASGGSGTYSWYEGSSTTTTTPITNASECTACGGTPQMTFGIFYNHCHDSGGNDISDCVSTTFSWNGAPYSTSATTSAPSSYPILIIDGAGDSLIVNNAGELSPCAVIPLNVSLASYELECNGNQVSLNWTTITEDNNDYFRIERAGPDGIFEEIAQIAGQDHSTSEILYRWIDKNPIGEESYYKLSQVDQNGNETILKTKSINCNDGSVEVYPNPFNNEIRIELGDLLLNSNGIIECYNAFGQLVIQEKIKDVSSHILSTSHLKQGVYIIRVTSEHAQHTTKLIKQ